MEEKVNIHNAEIRKVSLLCYEVIFESAGVPDSLSSISFSLIWLLLNFNPNSDYVQRRQWQPIPVLLPGKSHGWRSMVGCSPRGS